MALLNTGFETEDAAAIGFPDSWVVSITAAAEEAAGFDDGQTTPPDSPIPFDAFEGGWSSNESYTFAFSVPDDLLEVFPAFFDNALPDPEDLEDFEEGWSTNQNYLFGMASEAAASFDANVHLTTAPGPWVLTLNDTASITTDVGSDSLDPIVGTPADLIADSPASNFPHTGRTLQIVANKRATLDVTFDGSELDIGDISTAINTAAGIAGVGGELTAGIINVLGVFHLEILSDVEGFDSQIDVLNFTGGDDIAGDLGFGVGQIGADNGASGTGNISLIDAVQAEDLRDIINGAAGMLANGVGAVVTPAGELRISPNPEGTINIENDVGDIATVDLAPWTSTTGEAYAPGAVEGPAALPAALVDDLEGGWSNLVGVGFFFDWVGVTAGPGATAADFNTGPVLQHDPFERQWKSNESFDFTMGAATAAVWDTGPGGGSQTVEDFEEVNALKIITVTPGTDTINAVGHGNANGQTVTFENSNGILPGGLQPETAYFVVGAAANTFQVSTVSGGAAVDITDNGAGTHRVRADVATFWTSVMATI